MGDHTALYKLPDALAVMSSPSILKSTEVRETVALVGSITRIASNAILLLTEIDIVLEAG